MQRYDIFSRYDEGIWFTEESWYGVTPEPVAEQVHRTRRRDHWPPDQRSRIIAAHVSSSAPASKTVLIDAFAGIGGNAIAFARSGRWERIFAIERDEATLACAKHNAKVYGVEKKIWWIGGDCFDVLKKQLKSVGASAVVFASPPWGGRLSSPLSTSTAAATTLAQSRLTSESGPGYSTDEVFNLSTMQPYDLQKLYAAFAKISNEVVLYLPRTSDLNQLAALVPEGEGAQVTHYCMRGASKVRAPAVLPFWFIDGRR